MLLNDTIELMKSENYKDRFKAEYYQLIIRIENLDTFLNKYFEPEFGVKPTCSFAILNEQKNVMLAYKIILEERAIIEKVDLCIGDKNVK